jgi:hypothetical protein
MLKSATGRCTKIFALILALVIAAPAQLMQQIVSVPAPVSGGGGTITPGSWATPVTFTGATASGTASLSPSAGQRVTLFIFTNAVTTAMGCVDSGSNALTAGPQASTASSDLYAFTENVGSGITGFSCSWSGSANGWLMVGAYTNVAGGVNGSICSGVCEINANSGTASLTGTTQDANDYLVCAFADKASATFTVTVGTSRAAVTTGASRGVALDNTVASAGTVSCTATLSTNVWLAVGIELRT